jgi:hypothetical protein
MYTIRADPTKYISNRHNQYLLALSSHNNAAFDERRHLGCEPRTQLW